MLSINYQHHSVIRFNLRIYKLLVKSIIWLIFLSNQFQISELTSQSTSNSTSNTQQLEPTISEATLNNSSLDNSTTLLQVASTLEPIYFGKYPISDPHSLPQPPQHPASFQEPQTDFYASDTHPPLGSFYYGLKDDQLRRPNFGLEGSDEQDNDIVTLQAFGGNQDGSSRQRGSQSMDSDSLEPLQELDLSLLRQLPAHKQVQLVKKALMAAQTRRPTLNLVSGTILPRREQSHTNPMSYNESSLRNVNMMGSQQQQQYLADLLSQMKYHNPYGYQDPNEESDELQQNTGALNLNLNLQQQLQQLIGGKQPSKESIISHSNNNPDNDQHFLRRLVGGERAELDDNSGSQNELKLENDDKSSTTKAIPIERLVDHLMANSRLSTFGIQHDNLLLPEDEEVLDEGEDEEEEEEPEGDEANEDAQESALVEKKSMPPTANGFSPLLNKSSSWIPLDSILEKSSSSKNGVIRLRDIKRSKKKSESEEKLGSKSTRNSKKTKRKKRKKRKRDKRDGLGLVIGDKLLTRNDLIRLISILNKMSKKGKTAKEREASRKLLRYIIKLMLVDYKKNTLKEQMDSPPSSETKSEDKREKNIKEKSSKRIDSIRDLLRPLIEGPSDHEDREKKKEPKEKEKEDDDEDNLIELRPLLSDKFDAKKKSISNDTAAEDESPKEEDRDPKESEAKRKHIGLSELSEDLEQYFDTDFYEDMADKMGDKNKTHVGSASGTRVLRVAAKSGRRPRLVYTVPVPIYGQQLFEAADEDDTDFDAVPAKALLKRHRKRRRSAKRRTPRRRRTRVDDKDEQESDEAEEEEDEPSEPNEDEQEPPVAESEEQGKGRPAVSKEEVTYTQEDEQDSQAEQDEQELPKNEPGKITKRLKKSSNSAVKPTKKRKRRRRKRRKNKNESEVDYDSRYEIPAPIVAGRMASDLRRTGNSTKKEAQTLKKTIPAKKKGVTQTNNSKTSANSNSTSTNKSRKSRASKPTGKGSKPQIKHNDSVVQLDHKEQAPEEEDEDYYNEGTSYSKVCDDDGKCTISVQSSSPKLGRAIRSKDETSIAKQLGPWIAKSD